MDSDTEAAVGAALSALVAANAPALRFLRVESNGELGDTSMSPLFGALRVNTHLLTLNCVFNPFSAACAQNVLLPAVRKNTSLHRLLVLTMTEGAVEAVALVGARAVASRAVAMP